MDARNIWNTYGTERGIAMKEDKYIDGGENSSTCGFESPQRMGIKKLRKVLVYKYERVKGQTHFDRVCVGNGYFHQFGVDYEEFETGPGNYSTAIVEMPDGTVKNVPVKLIEFNN